MTSATVNSAAGGHHRGRMPGFVKTAAKALGMSGSDVMTALKSGKSLADLAKQQNVSVDSLSAALKANAPQDMQNSGNIDQAISSLVNRQGLGGHRHADAAASGSASSSSQNETLTALSSLLGSDPSSLLQQLQSGSSLSDLLSAKGVSLDALSDQLEKGLLIDTKG